MKKFILSLSSGFIFLAIFSGNVTYAKTLIFAYGSYWNEPVAIFSEKEYVGGISKNIADELGRRLGVQVNYKEIPRKRLEKYLLEGKAHLVIVGNPYWYKDPEKTKYEWSVELYRDSERFVTLAKNSFPIEKFEDLHGKKVGTTLGFFYPEVLQNMFKKGEVTQEQVKSYHQNFKKLEVGRTDCFIADYINIKYYIKKNDAQNMFKIGKLILSENGISAAISKQTSDVISIAKIKEALKEMKDNGKIDEILKQYE